MLCTIWTGLELSYSIVVSITRFASTIPTFPCITLFLLGLDGFLQSRCETMLTVRVIFFSPLIPLSEYFIGSSDFIFFCLFVGSRTMKSSSS